MKERNRIFFFSCHNNISHQLLILPLKRSNKCLQKSLWIFIVIITKETKKKREINETDEKILKKCFLILINYTERERVANEYL